MAFAVKIYGTYLDLLPDAQLSFEKNTELWTTGDPTVQIGSYSFPFDLPLTETNRYLLRFPERIDAYTTPQEIGDAVIYIGEGLSIGLPVFTGKLYVKTPSNRSVSCFIVVNGLGNKKDLKFTDVDMGVYNFAAPVNLKTVMDNAAENPLNSDFVFFPVMNNTLYDEYDGDWTHFPRDIFGSRIMNDYYNDEWGWQSESDVEKKKNAILVPFLRLEYVLHTAVSALGYTLVDNWLVTDEHKSICLFNNKSINNHDSIFNNIIRYNEHLPSEVTIVDFLKHVSKWMFVGIFVDHFSKTITLKPYKEVIKSVPRHDWTDRQTEDYDIDQDNKVPKSISYDIDSTDAYFNKTFVSVISLVLNGAVITDYFRAGGNPSTHGLIDGLYAVKRDGTVMRYDPSKIFHVDKWSVFNHQFSAINVNSNGEDVKIKCIPLYQDSYAPNGPVIEYSLPRCDISLTMNVKKGAEVKINTNKMSSIRPTIYRGFKNMIGVSGSYPYANNSAYDPDTEEESYDLSLHYDGEKGIYKNYGQEWIHFMKNKKVVKRNLALTVADILNHKEYDKVRIGNMNYFVKSMRITVTATGLGLTECELVTIPIS